MIEVVVKVTGFFVDKPRTMSILLEENDPAFEKKNLATGKLEVVTVGFLYDLWAKQTDYIKDASDPEDHLTAEFFPIYIFEKYIKGKSFESSIISVTYNKI
jgi:predicted metal-dependent hydrolase